MITPQPVLQRWLIDGVVLLDPVHQPGLLRLEGTGATLWHVLSGAPEGIDDDELVATLATEYGVAPDAVRADIERAVDQLAAHGAVRRD